MAGPVNWLVLAIAASGLMAVAAEERGSRELVYVFKPLTTILILALAALGLPGSYRALVVAGLAASLAGDVLLMLPRDRFVAGLLSFLVAHLAYGAAFATAPAAPGSWLVLGLLLALGLGVLRALWPGLGALRVPVTVYVAVILAMAWMAENRWLRTGGPGAAAAGIGALLFVLSDTLLALDRFRARLPFARALVLGSYYVAQLLIALSVRLSPT